MRIAAIWRRWAVATRYGEKALLTAKREEE
jgi:hypothetical protein